MTDFPTFTVEAIAGQRVAVRWQEGGVTFYFHARTEGDEVLAVLPASFRRGPTVIEGGRQAIRGATRYHDARSERFAPIVAEAVRQITAGQLATKARGAEARKRLQIEADRLAHKALTMRQALIPLLSREGREALAAVPDAPLADVYDRIQNSAC